MKKVFLPVSLALLAGISVSYSTTEYKKRPRSLRCEGSLRLPICLLSRCFRFFRLPDFYFSSKIIYPNRNYLSGKLYKKVSQLTDSPFPLSFNADSFTQKHPSDDQSILEVAGWQR